MASIPVIDLSAEGPSLVAAVGDACRTSGFMVVGEHGVASGVIDAAWRSARAFFDLPVAEKLTVRIREGNPYGYSPFAGEALARSVGGAPAADLKESFSIGPIGRPDGEPDHPYAHLADTPNRWPERPEDLRPAWEAYTRAMEHLATRIMRLMATSLGVAAGYFDPYITHQSGALRALNYPAQEVTPPPGQLRAGAHSDYGSLTILLPEAGSSGLEVDAGDGTWHRVPAIAGTFVVNIGDLMAVWTNDRWVSTVHRVVNPPPVDGRGPRRQSMAFFHLPNWRAVIAPMETCVEPGVAPRYQPVEAGEHLMMKFRRTIDVD